MRKASLLTILVLVTLVLPMVLATQNAILNVTGNNSALTFTLSTVQTSVNPVIGANVTYVTIVNVTGPDATWNLTSFDFYLPDNSSTTVATDFVLRNSSGSQKNASSFTAGNYNYVSFSGLGPYLNGSANGTTFNITWMLDEPISSTKISASQSGRVYTEKWNITSSATNLTIVNASLIVVPTYWYTRIGDPISVTFNNTAKDYVANYTSLKVYTDLNLSSNLQRYGSGWGELKVVYNGPTVSSSSGDKPSKPLSITPTETQARLALWTLTIIGIIAIIGLVIFLVIVLTKK